MPERLLAMTGPELIEYDLEYEADVVLSVHIYEKSFFQSPLGKVMPLFIHVRAEGVRI